ncbi:MAG: hypothetical protein GC151_00770 [Betaproteobacteria bacterium]|nr:hypothetical protein [Betaproteobacteria bacterium]
MRDLVGLRLEHRRTPSLEARLPAANIIRARVRLNSRERAFVRDAGEQVDRSALGRYDAPATHLPRIPIVSQTSRSSDTCPRCGARFRCGMQDTPPCACTTVRLTDVVLARLRERYEGCLCPACLRALAADPGLVRRDAGS